MLKGLKELDAFQKVIYFVSLFLFLTVNVVICALFLNYLNIFALFGFYAFVIGLGSLFIWLNNNWFKKMVNNNIFIFGVKGSGKDLLMQSAVYYNRKNKEYLSNMDFGYSSKKVDNLHQVLSLGDNTFRNLVEDDVKLINKKIGLEGKVFLLSDASIYFPSHEDSALKKAYPSFPLFYAISRHLYNMPFVVNTQVNGRLWKSLREQVQDGYIQAIKTIGKRESYFWNALPVLKNYLVVKMRYYEKEESAVNGLLPFSKVAIVNKLSDKTIYMTSAGATEEQYNAQNGVIKEKFIIINKKHIKYDDRHFHELYFGEKSPTTRKDG